MSIKEQLKRLETGYTPKSRYKTPVKEALNKLERAGRKRESLKHKEARESIPSNLNIGKDQGSTSGGDSEEIEYITTDGLFTFVHSD